MRYNFLTMFDYFIEYYYEQKFGWNFWATELIFIVGMVFLLDMPKPNWKSIGIFIAKMAGVFAVALFLNCIFYLIFGETVNRPLTYPLILTAYTLFICKYKLPARIPMACAFYSAYILSLNISETVGYMIEQSIGMSGQTPIAFLTSLVVSAAAVVYFRIFSYEKFAYVPWSTSILSSSLSLIGAIVVLLLNRLEGDDVSRTTSIVVATAFTLITIGGYLMFYYICRSYNDILSLKIKEKKMEAEQEYAKITKANLEELKKARHDIKNYYGYMKTLIDQGKYKEAGEYFDQLEEKIMPALNHSNSDNATIDTVINMEKRKAEDSSIALETRFIAVPPSLDIDDTDLTSILTNLIDNAIEATSKADSLGAVTIQITQRGNYLFINVTNPISKDADEKEILSLKTNKEDASIHGYGTKIVQELAEKHNGMSKFSVSDGRFIANVMLYNRSDNSHGA